MKTYRKEIFALIVLFVAGALYHGFDLEKSEKKRTAPHQEAPRPNVGEAQGIGPALPTHEEAGGGEAFASSGYSGRAPLPPLAERLREYAGLRQKVLMTEPERLRKLEILEDPRLLRELGELLRGQLQGAEMEQAVDLVLEARLYQEASVAAEVLAGVVADSRLEDSQISQFERERLAALKAEVLYLWSSSDPGAVDRIPSLLPGEVSHRLWRNVIEVQAQNQEESRRLQTHFASTGRHQMEGEDLRE